LSYWPPGPAFPPKITFPHFPLTSINREPYIQVMRSDTVPESREWFDGTLIRIGRIDRQGGALKCHTIRSTWQVTCKIPGGARFSAETDTRAEARKLAGTIRALITLAGNERYL
jgi:hypothetical protein